MRQTGELIKRYAGDEESAKQYLGEARVLLGRMKSYLAGAYGSKVWKLADGTVIVTKSMPHGDVVTIRVPEAERAVEFPLGGILCIPVADEAPIGWGAPITEANKPLGTIGGGPPRQAWLRARENGHFEPGFKVKRYTDISAGTIQWRGRSKHERLWFQGPPSRYFVAKWTRDTKIWTVDNKQVSAPGGVYGCAIYREGDGSGIVAAVHGTASTFRIHILKNGAWDEIGAVSIEGNDSWLTCCHFSPRGNKAAIVTFQGSVVEITIAYNNISVTRTPRMAYRYRNTRTVTDTLVATRTFTLDEDPAPGDQYIFDGSDDETIGHNTTWATTLLTVSPDNPATVLSESGDLTWERPICADYDANSELIVGKLRYEGAPRFYDYDNGFTEATYNAFSFPIDEIAPIQDINWWALNGNGEITEPHNFGVDQRPPVTLDRPAEMSASGTSTIITVNDNEYHQTFTVTGVNQDQEDNWSTSRVSTVNEVADIASLTISLVVDGTPEWSFEVFRDHWAVTYTRTNSEVDTGEFEGHATDTDSDNIVDERNCTSHKTGSLDTTIDSTQTLDIFSGRLRYVDLRTKDVLLDATEFRKYNGFTSSLGYTFDLSGSSTTSAVNAGILGSYDQVYNETITRWEFTNQSFHVVLDGEVQDVVYRFPNEDPEPEIIPSGTTTPLGEIGTPIDGPLIYLDLEARGESDNISDVTTTVKSASYDARCETSRDGDTSTSALYAGRALFFSGKSWDGALTYQNPLYLDGALRDAPAIFATSDFTNPRFNDIRSF